MPLFRTSFVSFFLINLFSLEVFAPTQDMTHSPASGAHTGCSAYQSQLEYISQNRLLWGLVKNIPIFFNPGICAECLPTKAANLAMSWKPLKFGIRADLTL
jgi:hypothetical protein